MCGIAFILSKADADAQPVGPEDAAGAIAPRGPDGRGVHAVPLGGGRRCVLLGSVLHMRGPRVVPQPRVDEATGAALLWNGEVFGGTLAVGAEQNDTEEVFCALRSTDNVMGVLEAIEGPFAFAFWQPACQRLWFGRDKLGRRSLVLCRSRDTNGEPQLAVSSVAVVPHGSTELPVGWEEVPVTGIFSVDLAAGIGEVQEHPWTQPLANLHSLKPDEAITSTDAAVDWYLAALSDAVRVRVTTVPEPHAASREESTGAPVAVLFSGGIDCMLLAALAHRHVPPHLPIDLLNVAFGDYPGETPDRVGSRNGLQELRGIAPDRQWNLVEIDLTAAEAEEAMPRLVRLIHPCDTVMDLNIATALWAAAQGKGCIRECGADPPVAVRSRLVRYGVADAVSESPASAPAESDGSSSPGGSVPDAAAIPDAFRPLCEALWALSAMPSSVDEERVRLSLLGGPEWPLPWRELGYRRMKLYVRAARDAGVVETGPEGDSMPWCRLTAAVREVYAARSAVQPEPAAPRRAVVSSARALLLGIGADETLAGYGRHRTTFLRGGTEALVAELELDFGRLWKRNLGRDDRVLSDWGKESRLPYLDEGVLAAVRSIPLQYRCNLTEPLGVGDKKLIRLAARRLGLTASAALQKRAIQFGTRIANRKLAGQRRLDGTEPLPCLNPRVG
eukprot:EG_transcript_5585